MPLDTRAVLSASQNFGVADTFNRAANNNINIQKGMKQNALLGMVTEQKKSQIDDAEIDRQIKSVVTGALRVKPLLDSGNLKGAMSFLEERASQINARGGDPSDTIEVLEQIRAGDTQGVMQNLDAAISFGQQVGLIGKQGQAGFTLNPGQTRFDAAGNVIAEVSEKIDKAGKSPEQIDRELDIKSEANIIRREELGFRKQQGQKVELSPTVQKILDASQTAAFDSGEQAREMELLAADLKDFDIGGGSSSTFSEKAKELLGSEEAVSDLRRRFRAIRSSRAVNNLPPGVASDKDIEMALSGFPGENANAETIQRFLRGQAKLARLDEAYNIVKSELLSEQGDTRGLISTWRNKLQDAEFQAATFKDIDGIRSVDDTSTVTRPQPVVSNSTPPPLPEGSAQNPDGTFTLPDGRRVRPKQ